MQTDDAELTVIVEFETIEGKEEAFTAAIREHARRTLAEEEGCLRFEVVKPVERDGTAIPNRVIVNELYRNEAAFAAHERNPRMPSVRAATGPLLKSQRLVLARSTSPALPDEGLAPDQLNASNDG